jgi:transcriptional regulator with XRE-family HTH domain
LRLEKSPGLRKIQMITANPHDLAERLIAEAPDLAWLRALTDDLDRRLRTEPLERFLTLWGLSLQDAADAFGVSRQAVSKWRQDGVPAGRTPVLADLAAATNLLDRKLKRERIPAVVRRASASLGGRSLLDLVTEGRHAETLGAVRYMFDLRRVQP